MTFTNDEVRRYGRHLIMPEVTLEGQQKLKAARVVVIGTGGLGAPILAYLAAAGVGHIGIVDFDTVDLSNLHRQIIHKTGNVGKLKTHSAVETMKEINPVIDIKTYDTSLRSDNALDLLRDYDVVIDGTDNFPTRYLVNDACALLDKPNVYGSIFRFEGQATVFWASRGPCYRCLHPEPPEPGTVPSCAEGGVLGVLPGVVGAIQATEAVKLLIGQGDPLTGRLLLFDALKMKFREMRLRKDPNCPLCGPKASIKELIDYEFFCGVAPVQKKVVHLEEIEVEEVKAALDTGKIPAEIDLLDIREPFEAKIAQIPGSRLISLAEFGKRMHELDSAREIWLYCKDGARSAKAWKLLHDAGFRKIKNVAGGIDAWSEEIDPNVPRY
ncbi:MAG TPA: molybdopterin-synthase adenylyltransferase MoeB [Candidatus Methylacidiphilales bacterium]|nr:molybdopterin-synthase adenylyltransferase MoeB [Candidatus Methylacidiphilales bacterium]